VSAQSALTFLAVATGSGQCTAVPQALTPEASAKAAALPRACAQSYPTTTSQGLLFVWLDSGPEALVESAMCATIATCPYFTDIYFLRFKTCCACPGDRRDCAS
jgi:phenylpropionate dioxygenase-like ring-hydroxylating dioxygenase large terminal subunit